MTNDPLYFVILLLILAISLDIVLFRWRRDLFAQGKSLTALGSELLLRAGEWIRALWARLPQLRLPQVELPQPQSKPAPPESAPMTIEPPQPSQPPQPPETESAIPAKAPEVHINETVTSTSTSLPAAAGGQVVHIQFTADIPEGTILHVTLQVVNADGKITTRQETLASATAIQRDATSPAGGDSLLKVRQWLGAQLSRVNAQSLSLNHYLFTAALVIYALVVSIGIDRFPIYFFTDEAIHMNLASDFIRDGFQNYYNEFLPTFFSVEGWVNGTSVYVQVLPFLLFGKSVIVTRLVAAFITLLGAAALGLMLKQTFKIKYYWAGIFLLLTTPAWFLHARTAFEYAEVASFYCVFLYFYSRYRDGDLRSFYAAIFAGALTFYTHGLGQILMAVTGLGLLIVDFGYHIHPRQRKTVLYGIGLGIILLMPFARYYLAHPTEAAAQIKRRGSYWVDDNLTLIQKLGEFFSQYLYGLNPRYWYLLNKTDLARHVMQGYGNGLLLTLPFAFWGFVQSIKNIRQPAYRMALIAFFAAPIPASVVAIGMPRMLWMSIPLAILTTLGLASMLQWLESRWRSISTWVTWGLFAALTFLSIFMLRDALVNGPLWFQDYGLYGMQFGAQQVFQETVVPELENDPDLRFVISPSWANGTEQFSSFFIPPDLQPHIRFGQPVNLIDTPDRFVDNTLFVVTANEYDSLLTDPKFKEINVQSMIPYPNGEPGFYVISLLPADNIDEVVLAQHAVNRTPVEGSAQINGQDMLVLHSPIGSGDLSNIFDDDPDTLARVLEANPFTFDLYPDMPIDTNSVVIQTGSLPNFTVTISLYAPGATDPVVYTQTFQGLPSDPLVTMNFDQGPGQSERIYIEIKDNLSGETSQIHVRTIMLK